MTRSAITMKMPLRQTAGRCAQVQERSENNERTSARICTDKVVKNKFYIK